MNRIKGWKTIIFNVIMAIIFLIEKMGGDWGLSDSLIATILMIGNFILRFFTDTPIMKSK